MDIDPMAHCKPDMLTVESVFSCKLRLCASCKSIRNLETMIAVRLQEIHGSDWVDTFVQI